MTKRSRVEHSPESAARPIFQESCDFEDAQDSAPEFYNRPYGPRWERWTGLGFLIRNESLWSPDDAKLILTGLHPSTQISDEKTHFVWLGERPEKWERGLNLTLPQILVRVMWEFFRFHKILGYIKVPVPPRLWILAAIDGGFIPPWLDVVNEFATKNDGPLATDHIGYFLPQKIGKQYLRAQKGAKARHKASQKDTEAVRDLWEKWVLGEVHTIESKKEFFERVSEKFGRFDEQALFKQIEKWETEMCVVYGIVDPNGVIGRDGRPEERGYNIYVGLQPASQWEQPPEKPIEEKASDGLPLPKKEATDRPVPPEILQARKRLLRYARKFAKSLRNTNRQSTSS